MTSHGIDVDALNELAPTGVLRVAFNLANDATLQVVGDTLKGAAPDAVAALQAWTGLEVEQLRYPSARPIVEAGAEGQEWDVACIAAEPSRADRFHFSAPYKLIEAKAAVPALSAIRSIDQLDQPGIRIASSSGAAYDAALARQLRHAQRVHYDNPGQSLIGFEEDGLDAVVAISTTLEKAFASRPEFRILPECVVGIGHAFAVHVSRPKAAALIDEFAAQTFPLGT